jgi:hypothetical protein
MRNKVLVLVAAMLSSAFCYVTGYHVEPIKASWSGWTSSQNNYVSEVITCNFDSLNYVELLPARRATACCNPNPDIGSWIRCESGIDAVQVVFVVWLRFGLSLDRHCRAIEVVFRRRDPAPGGQSCLDCQLSVFCTG